MNNEGKEQGHDGMTDHEIVTVNKIESLDIPKLTDYKLHNILDRILQVDKICSNKFFNYFKTVYQRNKTQFESLVRLCSIADKLTNEDCEYMINLCETNATEIRRKYTFRDCVPSFIMNTTKNGFKYTSKHLKSMVHFISFTTDDCIKNIISNFVGEMNFNELIQATQQTHTQNYYSSIVIEYISNGTNAVMDRECYNQTLNIMYKYEYDNYSTKNREGDCIIKYIQWATDTVKLIPDNATIDIVCENIDNVTLSYIFNNFKISATQTNIKSYKEFSNNRYIFIHNRQYSYDEIQPIIATIIDTLINNGLVITINDIVDLAKSGMCINNIERFVKTEEDTKLVYDACFSTNNFIYPTLLKLDTNMQNLYKLCAEPTSSYSEVAKLVKKGCVPDKTALKIACGNKNQKRTVKFLINHIKSDEECFKLLCDTIDPTHLLSEMFSKLEKN